MIFFDVQSCLHVQLILHWTDVDRVGQKFVFVCNVLDTECKSEHCLENYGCQVSEFTHTPNSAVADT